MNSLWYKWSPDIEEWITNDEPLVPIFVHKKKYKNKWIIIYRDTISGSFFATFSES